jgi:DNA-binding NtrC family response regulator
MLAGFDWPGNVRQLENSVFRAVILCEGEWLAPEDFPQIAGVRPRVAVETVDHAVQAAVKAASYAEPEPQPVAMFDEKGHVRALEKVERDLIAFAISHYAGHMSEVARRLGIGRSTLYRKLREYGLDESALKAG